LLEGLNKDPEEERQVACAEALMIKGTK